MKKTVIIIVLFAVLLAATAFVYPKLRDNYLNGISETITEEEETEKKVETVTPAADFTVYDRNGTAVRLSDFVGKPTVVNFWATWCVYCVEELPGFNNMYEEYRDRINFVMVDLADGKYETKDDALTFAEEKGYLFPVYFDSDSSASYAYSISGIPMTLFIAKDGSLYKTHNGYMNESTLKNYIDSLLSESD